MKVEVKNKKPAAPGRDPPGDASLERCGFKKTGFRFSFFPPNQ